MTLSDRDIKEYVSKPWGLKITPYDEKYVQPASYDVHLSRWFRAFKGNKAIDVKDDSPHTALWEKPILVIHPGEFLLGSTIEHLEVPDFLCGQLEGKSSIGRLGLIVHSTAGFIDPGFRGHVTLEITNFNRLPIRVYAGMPIGQVAFQRMSTIPEKPYGEVSGSKYQDQGEAPVESQFWKNFPDKILEQQ